MLLLTSVNDRLQIVTSTAATIDVHASWVDTTGVPVSTITPGRTNTAITTATTTNVAGAPAASTQRNVKTLHVRNKHASLACDITVLHSDGTTTVQLYKVALAAGDMMEYTDQAGFGGGRIAAPVVPPTPTIPVIKVLTVSGSYTPTANMTYCIVECVGGGAGGGSTSGAAPSYWLMAGGGGSGSYSKSLIAAATIGSAQTVTIGTGGAGAAVGAANGVTGGDTSLGTLCIAKGGLGGRSCVANQSTIGQGGAGGPAGTGDIAAAGNPGGAGFLGYEGASPGDAAFGVGADGGSSFFGGGAAASSGAGLAASKYGAGGSGSAAHQGNDLPGGNGSAGVIIITEYFV